MTTFSLLGAHASNDLVAFGEAGTRTAGELAACALSIAHALPEGSGGEVVVACCDRYHFAASVLAAWSRGLCVILPASSQPGSVEEAGAGTSVRAVLHDVNLTVGLQVRDFATRTASAATDRIAFEIDPRQPLVKLCTSGSTGAPRRWEKTARQLLGEAELHARTTCEGARRVVATVPSGHIYGLLFGVAVPLLGGAAFLRETLLHARAVLAAIDRYEADTLVSVPAHLKALEALAAGSLHKRLHVLSSGAPLEPELWQLLTEKLGFGVKEILGSTETGGIATRDSSHAAWHPLPGISVGADAAGQLLLDSPFLDASAERPFVCADRVRLDSPTAFHHLGRSDRVVKIAGKRIDADQMESRILTLPGILDAAVLALPSAQRGSRLEVAFVAPGWSPSLLRQALLEYFDPVVVPRRLYRLAALPREPTGKLQRDQLMALLEDARSRNKPALAQFEPVEDAHQPGIFDVLIPADLVYFQGHFASQPILAGSVQLSVLVLRQVAALWPELHRLRKVTRLRFKKPIRPGDRVQLALRRGSPWTVQFDITSAAGSCSAGTLHFQEGPLS